MLHWLTTTGCVKVSLGIHAPSLLITILTALSEILTYLGHTRDFWSSLVASDPALMKKIDLDTVDTLQLLAPGKSHNNAKTACGLILSGQAFAEFSDEERRTIWN